MFPDQRSTYEQLLSLVKLANKNGLYDAADWVRLRMANQEVQRISPTKTQADGDRDA